jgi:hypothetical protein
MRQLHGNTRARPEALADFDEKRLNFASADSRGSEPPLQGYPQALSKGLKITCSTGHGH